MLKTFRNRFLASAAIVGAPSLVLAQATPILDPADIVTNIESAGTSVTTVVMAVIAVLLIIFAFKMVRRAFGG